MKPSISHTCLWFLGLLFQTTVGLSDNDPPSKDKIAAFELAERNSQATKERLDKLEEVQRTFRIENRRVERSIDSLKYFTGDLDDMVKTVGAVDAWIRKIISLDDRYNQQASTTFVLVETYSQSADQALSAIDHYASSDSPAEQALESYTQAQTQSNRKLLNKQLTVEAVEQLLNSKKRIIDPLNEISRFHGRTLRELQYLSKNYREASSICLLVLNTIKNNQASSHQNESAQCQLIDEVRDQTQGLLAGEKTRWEQTGPLLEKIKNQLNDSYALFDAYHRQRITRSISQESRLFLQALNRQNPDDQIIKTELRLSSEKLASLDREIALKKEQLRAGIDDKTSRINLLMRLTAPLPQLSASDLSKGGKQVTDGLQLISTTVRQQVEAQRQAFNESVRIADAAYFAAYGEHRPRPLVAEQQLHLVAPVMADAAMASAWEVDEHVYARVYEIEREPEGYGAYTYVLFTQEYSRTNREEVKERYRALLEAIARSTDYYDRTQSKIPIIRMNIFCIPTQNGFDRYQELINGYHTELARSFIPTAGSGTLLTKEVIRKFARSPGPFLLTSKKRLSDGDAGAEQKLIFTDLSFYSPDTYDSILQAYKTNLEDGAAQNSQIWEPDLAHKIIFLAGKVTDLIPQLKDAIGNLVGAQNADGA